MSTYKLIIIGPKATGKTSFMRYMDENCKLYPRITEDSCISFVKYDVCINDLDINIELYEDNLKNYDNVKEINGCLLFFDTSRFLTFMELSNWLNNIRNNIGKVPIFLIGTKIDLEYGVNYENVKEFVLENELQGLFLLSIHFGFDCDQFLKQMAETLDMVYGAPARTLLFNNLRPPYIVDDQDRDNLILTLENVRNPIEENNTQLIDLSQLHTPEMSQELLNTIPPVLPPPAPPPPPPEPYYHDNYQEHGNFGLRSLRDEMLAELERLRRIMGEDNFENDDEYQNLSDEDREIFHAFLEYYSTCPVCKRENHQSYLKEFYFSTSYEKIFLKERLLILMGEAGGYNSVYYNQISLGIPCCECFEKFFPLG